MPSGRELRIGPSPGRRFWGTVNPCTAFDTAPAPSPGPGWRRMGTPPEHAGPRSQRRRGARGPSTPGGRPVSQAGSGRRRAVSHGKACAPWAVPGAPGRAASRKAPPRWGLGGPLLLRGRLRGCAGPGRASGGAPRPCPEEGSGGRPAPLPPPRGLSSHFVPRGKPGSAPRPAAWFRFPSPARRRDSVQTPGRRRAGPEASGRGGGGGLGSARPRPLRSRHAFAGRGGCGGAVPR